MAFALVYFGEHYVADLIGGALLAAFVVAAERYVRLRSERERPVPARALAGRARALGADDQPAVRARLAHDRVRS
jgi:membrane-associated phospholipid phosphatase